MTYKPMFLHRGSVAYCIWTEVLSRSNALRARNYKVMNFSFCVSFSCPVLKILHISNTVMWSHFIIYMYTYT